MIPDSTLAALDLGAVLGEVAALARTAPGAAAVRALRPVTVSRALAPTLDRVAEAGRFLEAEGDLLPQGLPDPSPALARLGREGDILEALEARVLAQWLGAADDAARQIAAAPTPVPRLAEALRPLRGASAPFRPLLRVITPSGEVEDAASPGIAEARQRVRAARAALTERLERMLQDPAVSRHLQDRFVTLRGERYVIPLRAESRAELPGILHATSSSGQTLFVEPMATVDLNNDLVAGREAEQEEVRRFLAEMTARLRVRLPEVVSAVEVLAGVDADLARARWGRERDARLAESAEEVCVELEGARHPLLERSLAGGARVLVPLDLSLGPEPRLLVISGPNAGGKSVALKTVGLLCLMHQCAIPVPARRARLPVLAGLAIDIGDQQSIAESLSTFSARMRNLAAMAAMKEEPLLVLLDELGSGTDPLEGGALGIALLEHFRVRGALVVATTHHDQIRAHALSTPGLASAAMEFDARRLEPTYRLRPGQPGVSAGLEIAERMGLPRRIVEEARRRLGEAGRRAAALLDRLREKVDEAERRVADLDRRGVELEEAEAARAQQAEARERERAQAFERRLGAGLEEIRRRGQEALERLAGRERERAERVFTRSLGRAAAQARALAPDEAAAPEQGDPGAAAALRPGSQVRVVSLRQQGVVEEISGAGEASVLVRGVRVRAPLSDLAPAGEPAAAPRVGWEVSSRAAVPDRIELIGARIEEALQRLDKFLDDAALAGHEQVRVIHGSGSGRLRAAVGSFLGGHPHVAEHRLEEEVPGGRGVTLVKLRE